MNTQIEQLVARLNKVYTDKGINAVAQAKQVQENAYHVQCLFDNHIENYLVFKDEQGQPVFLRDFPIAEYLARYGEPVNG